jgi:hypothetical protein
MTGIGPPLGQLVRRLADTPSEFLGEPKLGSNGHVAVAALVNDLMQMRGDLVDLKFLRLFAPNASSADRNHSALTMIAVWLLADDGLIQRHENSPSIEDFLHAKLLTLSKLTPAHLFVDDPHRREELARVALAALNLRPQGETQAQADDRLTRISSAERHRLLLASRTAELRA